jgi:hypothetical protein
MSSSVENKLISLLTKSQSDIRQIKSDLRSLLTLLKEQQKPTPASLHSDDTANSLRARSQARLKTSFCICGKREGSRVFVGWPL